MRSSACRHGCTNGSDMSLGLGLVNAYAHLVPSFGFGLDLFLTLSISCAWVKMLPPIALKLLTRMRQGI
jgi:hypothetical protein